MPSLWEGLPLSMVLAMGAGLRCRRDARRRHSRSRAGRPHRPARAAGQRRRARRGAGAAGRRTGASRARSARPRATFVLPRFGVDGYVESVDGALRSAARGEGPRVTLGILYHMPFWQAADGSAVGRSKDRSRATSIRSRRTSTRSCSPCRRSIRRRPPARACARRTCGWRRCRISRPAAVLSRAAGDLSAAPPLGRRLRRAPLPRADAGGAFAFRLARQAGKPVFLLVVGDYQALLPHLPYRGIKTRAVRAYVAFEEWALARMTKQRADVRQRRGAARQARARRARACTRRRPRR